MHPADNKAFIQRLRDGDNKAFEEVYFKFNRPLYGMAYRYLRNRELAEDAIQDVFVKLWNNRDNLNSDKSLHGFLFSTLKNHVLNMLKSNTRRVFRNYEYVYPFENEGINPENHIIEEDYDRLLQKALKNMPSSKKEVFNLKNKGLSYEDISEQMGVSINTVKSHLYQARKFIQNYIVKHSAVEQQKPQKD